MPARVARARAALGRADVPLLLVLALSLALNGVGLGWGLPNTMDWAIDSVAPYRVLQAAYFRFSGGWWDKYPPVHLATLAALYVPYLAYLKLTGGLETPRSTFPFGLVDPFSSLGSMILLSRVVSVLMGTAVVLLVYLTVRELFDRRAALFSALVVALVHPFVYYAHTANLDVPYLFWSMLAIHRLVRISRRGATVDYALFALFAMLAICTKDQAYGLFLLSPLPLVWMRATSRGAGRSAGMLAEPGAAASSRLRGWAAIVLDRRHLWAAAVATVTFVLAHNLLFNLAGFLEHVRFITGPGSEEYEWFSPTLRGRLALLAETIRLMASAMTPPLFAICVAGAIRCALEFPRRTLPLLFLAASYYVLFLNALLNVAPRFVLPIAIVLAFFGGKLLADLWHGPRWRPAVRTAICLALAYAALFPIQLDVLFLRDSRYGAERWLEAQVPAGAVVETFAPHSLHNYYPRFPARVKVRSSWLAAGTRWDARTPRPDRVQLPNLYTGKEPAHTIVLSHLWYARFLEPDMRDTPEARVLRDLFSGDLGYERVAAFETSTLVPVRHLPLNPRILVFERE